MQAISDIFEAFESVPSMATALGRKYDTVLAWRLRSRIPEDAWDDVVAALAQLGHVVTADKIRSLNAPMKPRGRPAHKVVPIRSRRETRQ